MATIQEPVKIGNYWTNGLDSNTGESVNYEEVAEWYDGTPMDDSKVDGVIYRKLPASSGGSYVKRVYSGYADLSWFGVADGDDISNTLNSATQIAPNLTIPSGEYVLSTSVTLPYNASIKGVGRVTIKTTGALENAILLGDDSYDTLPALAASIDKASKSIQFSAPHDLNVGDVFFVHDQTNESYSGWRPYYRKGEFFSVNSVSGNSVTVDTYPSDNYSIPNPNLILGKISNPATGSIKNITIDNSEGNVTTLLRIVHGRNVIIDNLNLIEGVSSNLQIYQTMGATVSNVKSFIRKSGTFITKYSLGISNSQDVIVDSCELSSVRHGLSIGGSTEIGDIVNRNIIISNSIIKGLGGVAAADTHGNAEYVKFIGNIIYGARLRGNHIDFSNNTVYSDAMCVTLGEMSGCDYNISGNIMYSKTSESLTEGSGVFVDVAGSGDAFDSRTYTGGEIYIKNNKFVYGINRNTDSLISIKNRGCEQDISVTVSGNTVKPEFTSPNPKIRTFTDIGNYSEDENYGFSRVVVDNNTTLGGVYAKSAKDIHVTNNRIDGSMFNGVRVVLNNTFTHDNVIIEGNYMYDISRTGIFVDGISGSPELLSFVKISNNKTKNINTSASSDEKSHVFVRNSNFVYFTDHIGLQAVNQEYKARLLNNTGTYVYAINIDGIGSVINNSINSSTISDREGYGSILPAGVDFNTVGFSPAMISATEAGAPPSVAGVSRWWTYKQLLDNQGVWTQIAYGRSTGANGIPVIAIRTYNVSTSAPTPWQLIGVPAAASANTATSVGATYNQTQVQAILTELRDLKTKMRDAGLLAT